MNINLWTVVAGGVAAMVVGMVWYGPMFGKMWMKIVGATEMDKEARRKMQKAAGPLYLIQFLSVLFQVYVLAWLALGWQGMNALEISLWIWAAFIVPTVAGGAMWNNDSAKISWARFLIQAGYYLVLFVIFGLMLMYWR